LPCKPAQSPARRHGRAAGLGRYRKIRHLVRDLKATDELLAICRFAVSAQRLSERSASSRYTVSSLFLHQCFFELTADQKEQFFFITGPEVSGTLVLDQRVALAHERRSVTGVTGDARDTHRLLILLEPLDIASSATPIPIPAPGRTRPGHPALTKIFSGGWRTADTQPLAQSSRATVGCASSGSTARLISEFLEQE